MREQERAPLVDGESARLEWVDSKDASEADGGGALARSCASTRKNPCPKEQVFR